MPCSRRRDRQQVFRVDLGFQFQNEVIDLIVRRRKFLLEMLQALQCAGVFFLLGQQGCTMKPKQHGPLGEL